ncbi:MAG: hypothetical protein EAZ97_16380, partial [Bacteroidetes bacterium]
GIREIADIFPKYYILKVNNFNNVAKDTLDEWIYFLKNSEIPKDCKAKGLKEASEKLRIDQLSEQERKDYDRFKEDRWLEKDILQTAERKGMRKGLKKGLEEGLQKGMEKGLEKGKKERNIEIAKSLKLKNIPLEIISETTGLSVEEIEKL